MTEHNAPVEERLNPFALVVRGQHGERYSDLAEAWEELQALLSIGPMTVDDLIAATGLRRNTVKGFMYNGRHAGKVRRVRIKRVVDAGPHVEMTVTLTAHELRPEHDG